MNLTPDQAARVRRAAHLLHTELRLPRDDMLRLLPAVLRAPHFVQVGAPEGLLQSVHAAFCTAARQGCHGKPANQREIFFVLALPSSCCHAFTPAPLPATHPAAHLCRTACAG